MKPQKQSKYPIGDPNPDVTTPANSGELIIPWNRVINWPRGYVYPMGLTQTQHSTHSPGVTFEQFTSSWKTVSNVDQKLFLRDIIKAVKEQSGEAKFNRTRGVWKIKGPQGTTVVHAIHKSSDPMAYRNIIKRLETIGLGNHWIIDRWKSTYRSKQMKDQQTPTLREHFVDKHNVTNDDIVNLTDDDLKELHGTFPECQFKIEAQRHGAKPKSWADASPYFPDSLVTRFENSQSIWNRRPVRVIEPNSEINEDYLSLNENQPNRNEYTELNPVDSDGIRYERYIDDAVKNKRAERRRSFKIRDLQVITPNHTFSLLGQFNVNDPKSSPKPGSVIHLMATSYTKHTFEKHEIQERSLQTQWLNAIKEHLTPHSAFFHKPTKSIIEVYHTKNGEKLIVGPDGFLHPKDQGAALYEIDKANLSLKSVHDPDFDFTTTPTAYVHRLLSQAGAIPNNKTPIIEIEPEEESLCKHDLNPSTCAICNPPKMRRRRSSSWKTVTAFQKFAPYGIPKEKGGDNAENVERMERCVNKLMKEGHDKSSAIAICKSSLGFTKKKEKKQAWKSVTSQIEKKKPKKPKKPKNPVVPSTPTDPSSNYNEKDDPIIAFVNASTLLTDTEVELIQKACQQQVDNHFGPIWHLGMRSVFVPKGQTASNEAWQLIFLDNPTISGALGYHDFQMGQPLAYVFVSSSQKAGISPSSVASHEILEMLGDPLINITAQVGNQTFYAYEACDAVQQSSYTINIASNGVSYPIEVSNFVTPDWFRQQTNGPWDFLNKLSGPLELLPNGSYIGMWTPKTGWMQKNAFGDIKPIDDDEKRYVGVYHQPQEPQRCLRPFQRRQLDKPFEVTSAWKTISKFFRDETIEELRQNFDKREEKSKTLNVERWKTYRAEDRATSTFDIPWDPNDLSGTVEKRIELRKRVQHPLMSDYIGSHEADKHISEVQKQQWFRDAFHPVFHNLKITTKPKTKFKDDYRNQVTVGETDIKYKKLKDPTDSPVYDSNKDVLRAWHPNLFRKLLDKTRIQKDSEGNETTLNLPSKAFIKIPGKAMSRKILTHEMAHVLTAFQLGHHEEFRGVHLYLTKKIHGDEAFHELRKQYLYKGLRSTYKTLNSEKLDKDFISAIDEDQEKINMGQMYKASAKPEGGNCYEVAGKYLMDNFHRDGAMRLVHGTVTSNERLGHFGHAWIEIGDQVIDNSNLPGWAVALGQDFIYDKEGYYKKGGIIDTVVYDFPTMRKHILKTMHWGPWHATNAKHSSEQSSKLWLDDIRPAPQGWHHVRTAEEAIEALSHGGYTEISLDHDLGPEGTGTGYDVVKWLEEQKYINPDFVMPQWAVHSANPVGRERMEKVLKKITSWKSITSAKKRPKTNPDQTNLDLFPETKKPEKQPKKRKVKLRRTDYYFIRPYTAQNEGSCSAHSSECHLQGKVQPGDKMLRVMGIPKTVVAGNVKFLHAGGACEDINLAALDREARRIEEEKYK